MRDSFGGAFMIQLSLVFVIIYVSFMAVAFNYAKAFRVKNAVINILEQYQYNGTVDDPALEQVNRYLTNVAYTYGDNESLRSDCEEYGEDATFTENGACIVPKGNVDSRYYKIITYIPISFPFFNLNFHVAISGETKIIST